MPMRTGRQCVLGALHCWHSLREPPALCGVTRVPWGCCCVWCGCTPSLPCAWGAAGVEAAGLRAPSPRRWWVQAGWGWVTVISLPAG